MRTLLVLAALALTFGCAGPNANAPQTVYTSVRPPPPRDDVVPPQPGEDYVWLPGYWRWTDQGYEWSQGHWEEPPGRDYAWQRSGWVRQGTGYRFVPGHWYRYGTPHDVPYVVRYPGRTPEEGAVAESEPSQP